MFNNMDPLSAQWLKCWDIVKGMVKDKTPGSDGFIMTFFHDCWDIVWEDIMKVFHELHSFVKFEESLNATFITLIPKRP